MELLERSEQSKQSERLLSRKHIKNSKNSKSSESESEPQKDCKNDRKYSYSKNGDKNGKTSILYLHTVIREQGGFLLLPENRYSNSGYSKENRRIIRKYTPYIQQKQ